MSSNHLTLRLNRDETLRVERLRDSLGLTKSDLVKHALRQLADQAAGRLRHLSIGATPITTRRKTSFAATPVHCSCRPPGKWCRR